jgi:hypothetical protein
VDCAVQCPEQVFWQEPEQSSEQMPVHFPAQPLAQVPPQLPSPHSAVQLPVQVPWQPPSQRLSQPAAAVCGAMATNPMTANTGSALPRRRRRDVLTGFFIVQALDEPEQLPVQVESQPPHLPPQSPMQSPRQLSTQFSEQLALQVSPKQLARAGVAASPKPTTAKVGMTLARKKPRRSTLFAMRTPSQSSSLLRIQSNTTRCGDILPRQEKCK